MYWPGGEQKVKQLARRIILAVASAALYSTLSAGLAQAANTPSPAVVKGTAWLQAQVQSTGALTNEHLSIATPLQNRAESLQTFKLLATIPVPLADQLAADTQGNTEYLARRAVTLSIAGRDASAITAQLLIRQNADGGFGGAAGYDSNALDTALVILALKATSYSSAQTISAALSYLQSAQQVSGAYSVGAAEKVYVSAIVLEAFSVYASQYDLNAPIQKTVSYLLSKQIAPGNWENSVLSSAVAYLALHDLISLEPTATASTGYLTSNQSPDGSWNSDPYLTAVVLRALSVASLAPANPVLSTLRAKIVDSQTGLPLAGVTANLTGSAALTVTSAADGLIEFTNIPPGSYTVQFALASYGSLSTSTITQAGQTLDLGILQLSKMSSTGTGTVQGVILDNTLGVPLAGVTVSANGVTAITNTFGNYTLINVPSGTVALQAAKVGYNTVTSTASLAANSILTFSANLSPNVTPPNPNQGTVSGIAVDAGTNLPLANVAITVTFAGAVQSLKTDANGRFSVSGINAADATLQFFLAGYAGSSVDVHVGGGTDVITLFPPVLSDIGQVRLHKLDVVPPLPDLFVKTLTRQGSVNDPQTLNLSGTITVEVANQGTVSAPGNVSVLAFYDANHNGIYDDGVDVKLGSAPTPNSLNPGASALFAVPVQGQLPFRDAPISVWVDSAQTVPESNEANNFASTADFTLVKPTIGTLQPTLKWAWTGSTVLPQYDQVMTTPIVAPLEDTNGDGKIDQKDIPAVIFQTFGFSYPNSGVLRAVSGKDGHELWTVTNPAYRTVPAASIAVADIDGDGIVEIIAPKSGGGVIAFDHTGAFKWQNTQPVSSNYDGISIADLDGDGTPEIVVGTAVLNADGSLRWQGGGYFTGGNVPYVHLGSLSVVADIDLDGKPEIIAGASAYSSTGALLWVNYPVGDGFVAIGKFDSGPYPGIVVVSSGRVFLLNHDGTVKWGPVYLPGSGYGGAPTVADMDGDGIPEIGVAGARRYVVLRADGSILWTAPTQDRSTLTGSSVFDFAGDGTSEVVYGDELNLHVYNGKDGKELYTIPNSDGTIYELPVVVDVDNDNHADIVLCTNNYQWGSNGTGIRVYSDANNSWVNTRKIWNQHSYHITNINDNGTVPKIEQNSWQLNNSYRQNAFPGQSATAFTDLTASYLRIQDLGGTQPSVLTARVGNGGAIAAQSGVSVAFYNGQPGAGGVLLGTTKTASALTLGTFEDVHLNIATLNGISQIFVVVDDNGAGVHAIDDFNRTNNLHSMPVVAQMASLSIGAVTDASAYGANSPVMVSATVQNHGSLDATPAMRFSIESADGSATVVVLQSNMPVMVGRNSTLVVSNVWNTAATYAGNYRAKVELIGSNGAPFAAAFAPFAIVSNGAVPGGTGVGAAVTVDKQSYQPYDRVQIANRITNLFTNQTQSGLQAVVSVLRPDGSVLWTQSAALQQLLAASFIDLPLSTQLATAPAGQYSVIISVLNANAVEMARATTGFTVLSTANTGNGLKGTLGALPKIVPQTDPVVLNWTASNLGNADFAALPVKLTIADPATLQAMTQQTYTIALAQGKSYQTAFTWDTSHANVGSNYVAILAATVGGKDIVLAQDNFLVTFPPVKLGVTQSSVRENRVLVWLACDSGVDQAAADNGERAKASGDQASGDKTSGDKSAGNKDHAQPLVQPCIQTRTVFLEGWLTSLKVPHLITTNRDDFRNAFREGRYNVYWLSGDIKLGASDPAQNGDGRDARNRDGNKGKAGKAGKGDGRHDNAHPENNGENLLEEIREAVYRGDSLIQDGTQHGASLLETAGLTYNGQLSSTNLPLNTAGLLFNAQLLPSDGHARKLQLTTGAAQATFVVPANADEHQNNDGQNNGDQQKNNGDQQNNDGNNGDGHQNNGGLQKADGKNNAQPSDHHPADDAHKPRHLACHRQQRLRKRARTDLRLRPGRHPAKQRGPGCLDAPCCKPD